MPDGAHDHAGYATDAEIADIRAESDAQATALLGLQTEVRGLRDRLEGHIANHGTPPPPEPDLVDYLLNPFYGTTHPSTALFYSPVTNRTRLIPGYDGAVEVNAGRWGLPIVLASSSDPSAAVNGVDIPHCPVPVAPAAGTDGHLAVISPDRRTAWEMYAASVDANGKLTGARYGPFVVDLAAGDIYDAWARAYGGSGIIGRLQQEHVARGYVGNALQVGFGRRLLGPKSKSAYVPPARSTDSFAAGSDGIGYLGQNPMGTRITTDIDCTSLVTSPAAKVMAATFYQYGAFATFMANDYTHVTALLGPEFEPERNAILADMRVLAPHFRLAS